MVEGINKFQGRSTRVLELREFFSSLVGIAVVIGSFAQ